MIVRSVSLPRCVRDCFGNLWRPVFSEQGTRTAWCCESSCTYEADDTCINLACSMRYDRQHLVVYVIGVECVKVVSFFSSKQYVRALAQLSCRLAREDEQNNTLAHVMCKGFIQRCRRTLMFPSPTTYSKQLQWRTVIFRMAKRMVVWARVVHAKQHHLSSKVWVFCRLW